MSTAYGKQVVHFEFYDWKRKNPYKDPSGSSAGYQTILQTLVPTKNFFFVASLIDCRFDLSLPFRLENTTLEVIGVKVDLFIMID